MEKFANIVSAAGVTAANRGTAMQCVCRITLIVLSAVFMVSSISPVGAQVYPSKPIRFIVPFVPGGSTDLVARFVAQKLSEVLGQQVVIDNRGGAGGTIGTEVAARAAPDGYTVVLASANTAMNVSLYPKWPVNPLRDLDAVSLLGSAPNAVAVHPSLPVRTVKQLLALAKAKPQQIVYASGGNGSTSHMAYELLKMLAHIEMLLVQYKGTGPAIIGTLSGEASVVIPPASVVFPHSKSGKMRVLAICSATRFEGEPDLVTMAEAGVPGYEASQWYGVMVPAGTSKDVVSRLNREIVVIMKSPDTKERLLRDATTSSGSTPQEFDAYLRSEIDKWTKVVKLSGARVE